MSCFRGSEPRNAGAAGSRQTRGGAKSGALACDEIDARDREHFRRQVRELRMHLHLRELLQARRVRLARVEFDREAALAGVVRERWSAVSPEGSSWVTDTGCGLRYENVPLNPHSGIACGMAFLAPAARRFLCFLTAEQRAAFDGLIWPVDRGFSDDSEAR